MRRKFKSKQITRHTKVSEDGIQFASKLELYMYRQLKKENIKNIYEGKTFQIIEGCHFDMDSWEKTKGSKQLADRGNKKLLGIKYTPDFIDVQDPPRFIIETKGNPNESFPTYMSAEQRYGMTSSIFLLYKERQLFLSTLAVI